jgi:hypothetical protein
MALWKKKKDELPAPNERVLAFCPEYPPGDFLRLRLTSGQFVKHMEDVEQWAYCEELLKLQEEQ